MVAPDRPALASADEGAAVTVSHAPSRRVCHLVHTLAPGGAQELLVHLAAAAPAARLDVSVVSLSPAAEHPAAVDLRRLGVPVRDLGAAAHDPRLVRQSLEAVRQLAPDVLHTHGKRADLLGALLARRLHLPQVSTLHLMEDGGGTVGGLLTWSVGRVRGRAARTVVVSEAQHRWYAGTLPAAAAGRVRTVHNGVPRPVEVPAERRRQVRAQLGVADGQLLVLALGLMRPDRGHTHLVEAARWLPPDVAVVLAGDGPLRTALERQARAAPGAPVLFAGFRQDLPELLAAADLVAHPSLSDALPTALLHALAAGRPVVASDVGGIPEIVDDVGLRVPPGDPRALAAAVEQLRADPARRRWMSESGLARYQAHFSVEAWVGRLSVVYEQALLHHTSTGATDERATQTT